MFMTLSYIIKNRQISTLFGFFISIDRLKHFLNFLVDFVTWNLTFSFNYMVSFFLNKFNFSIY